MVGQAPPHILAAATSVFAGVGFSGARVDEIAARAGVNKAMLYYHVGNKRALYHAVIRSTLATIRLALAEVLASSPEPPAQLRGVARRIALFAADDPAPVAILFREVATGGNNLDDALLHELAELFTNIRSIYERGARTGAFRATDPLVSHFAFVGGLFFLVGSEPLRRRLRAEMAPVAEAGETPEALADRFTDLLLDGLHLRQGDPS